MIIIKIGGGATLDLGAITDDLARISHQERILVVHGANASRDDLARNLGIELQRVTSISGVESVLTGPEAVDLLMMAYAGLRNKRLVELLQQRKVNAVGLSGLDGKVIEARRNPGIRTEVDGRRRLLRDLSGRARRANRELLDLLLEHGYLPVLTVPLVDENGCAVSSENDDVVAVLQKEFNVARVIQLVEAPGLLRDPEDEGSLIQKLHQDDLASWAATATGRIKRKLLAVSRLIEQGVEEVLIADGRIPNPITAALDGRGTVIT